MGDTAEQSEQRAATRSQSFGNRLHITPGNTGSGSGCHLLRSASPLPHGDSNFASRRRTGPSIKTQCYLSSEPYLAFDALRVGGRLGRGDLLASKKHPILLPHRSNATAMIIRHVHRNLGHVGRNHVLAKLWEKYWIIRGNSTVRKAISGCITCRKYQAPVSEQKMADIPPERITVSPPFTNCGVDYFGPYVIKESRKEIKQYGCIFTCLASRAIHLEPAACLDTDSSISCVPSVD